jgi:hypothetical protein
MEKRSPPNHRIYWHELHSCTIRTDSLSQCDWILLFIGCLMRRVNQLSWLKLWYFSLASGGCAVQILTGIQLFFLTDVGFKVLLVVVTKNSIFCDIMPQINSTNVLEEHQLAFTRQHDTVSQEIELFMSQLMVSQVPLDEGQNLDIGHNCFLLYNFQFTAP